MKRRIFLGILSAAMLIAGSIAIPDSAEAQLFNRDQLRCRSRIAAATRRYYERQSRARRACVKRIITGKIPPSTDCIKSDGDATLQRQLPQIRAVVGRIIPRSCSGINLIFLGYPGICTDVTGPPFDTRDLESCILSETDGIVKMLLMNSYPEIDSFLRGADSTCVRGVADRTAGAVTQNLRARLKCLIGQERRQISQDVACRADIPPYENGTTSAGLDAQIEASYVRVLSGIPSVCGSSDLVKLGLNLMCDDATGEDFNLFDLKQCLLDDVRAFLPDLLDIPFPREPVCGDGVLAGDEECDDGQSNNSDTRPDACRVDCTLPSCGDGVVDPSLSEECDDAGLVDGDGCASDCTVEFCGDGQVNNSGTEECDEGSSNSDTTPDACREDCTDPSCGDGVTDTGEACDDGNNVSEDGCRADCGAIERCGDGVLQRGLNEQCDNGAANSDTAPDACRTDCTNFSCGDGVTDPAGNEECDDANANDDDGCSNECIECGNGEIGGDEECDDGELNSDLEPDACRTSCVDPSCGDGVIDPGNSEVCDDNNTNPNDLCTDICQVAACGDGRLCTDPILCATGPGNGIEECDSGVANSDEQADACRTNCALPTCGDGTVDTGEDCDDGIDNSDDTPDACRTNCAAATCGDGVIDPGNSETCDDGNNDDNDLCTNSCQVAVCGDGILCTNPIVCGTGPGGGIEECDDGAGNSDTLADSCRTDCSNPGCGDGVIDSSEECDGDPAACASNELCLDSCACKHLCPSVGELTIFAGAGSLCDDNADCIVGNCDPTVGRCRTVTELDSGWNGISHDADVNDLTITRGFLDCPATGPICGECTIAGVDPSAGNCRCSADNRTFCDETFDTDPQCDFGSCIGLVCQNDPGRASCSVDADCIDGGSGEDLGPCTGTCSGNDDVVCRTDDVCTGAACNCYFGAPFPLSAGGTPACVLNRFFEDISGTGNVDTGEGEVRANLRTQVFLGVSGINPCPYCGGVCEGDTGTTCAFDEDCGAGGNCLLDEIPNDGVRGGVCIEGEDEGKACDINAINTTFPARNMKRPGGAGYSLDCFPDVGKNVSGAGLRIALTQTTGQVSLDANVACGSNPALLCPCKQCTGDPSVPCNSDAECADQEGSCSVVTTARCMGDGDCQGVSAGDCRALSPTIRRCANAFSLSCTTNADCASVNGGSCNLSTCSSVGSGNAVQPNACSDGICIDQGDGEGACNVGPNERTCDGVVRANGQGFLGCVNDLSCAASSIGIDAGACALEKRRECFLDPIVAEGVANPNAPIGAATFCIPPTGSSGINGAAGLPGPGRVVNQATAITFCAEDPDSTYTPGVGGCPE